MNDEPEPIFDAMIDAIEVVRSQELLEMAEMVAVSVAAGLAMAGASMSQKGLDQAMSSYRQWVAGKQAIVTGTVGFDVDEHGTPLLHSADDIRRWFMEKGGLAV